MNPARRNLLMASAAAAAVVGSLEMAAAQGQPHTSETLRTESTGPQDPPLHQFAERLQCAAQREA
jgi:hypothetical protein